MLESARGCSRSCAKEEDIFLVRRPAHHRYEIMDDLLHIASDHVLVVVSFSEKHDVISRALVVEGCLLPIRSGYQRSVDERVVVFRREGIWLGSRIHSRLNAPRGRRVEFQFDRTLQRIRPLAYDVHKDVRPSEVAQLIGVVCSKIDLVLCGYCSSAPTRYSPRLLVDLFKLQRARFVVSREFLHVAPRVVNSVTSRRPRRHRDVDRSRASAVHGESYVDEVRSRALVERDRVADGPGLRACSRAPEAEDQDNYAERDSTRVSISHRGLQVLLCQISRFPQRPLRPLRLELVLTRRGRRGRGEFLARTGRELLV